MPKMIYLPITLTAMLTMTGCESDENRRLADLAACRVMPPHVDRYEREQRLFGMLDAIEYWLGTAKRDR